nr:hypothetical protein HmN_000123400 [Hymenolepis microstoma]
MWKNSLPSCSTLYHEASPKNFQISLVTSICVRKIFTEFCQNIKLPPQYKNLSQEEDFYIYLSESTGSVQITHPTLEPKTPSSAKENHMTPTLPVPYHSVDGFHTFQLHNKGGNKSINPTQYSNPYQLLPAICRMRTLFTHTLGNQPW